MDTKEMMSAFPKGLILPWFDTSGPVPDGWEICDGGDGRPNLKGKMLMGASDFGDVGDEGGKEKHDFTIPPHSHNIAKGSATNAMRAESGGGVISHTTEMNYVFNGYTEQEPSVDIVLNNHPPYVKVLFIIKL